MERSCVSWPAWPAIPFRRRRACSQRGNIHGFRSSFRDWCGEETSFPSELAEAALAHVTGDATERAYRRGDALEKRRKLMDAWAQFCGQKSVDNVVHMRRQAVADYR